LKEKSEAKPGTKVKPKEKKQEEKKPKEK